MQTISDTQLIFLDNLIYLNIGDFNGETLETAIKEISFNIDNYFDEADPPAAMTKEQWVQLLTSFRDNPANTEFLKNYKITNYVTNDTDTNGFRAACFVNVNDVTDVAAIFRGTYGGIEWEDDFLMANDVWSEEMDKAIHYINSLPAEYGNNIDVSGHSKGGNKSQYVTILTDRIGRCVSFDGQGFSKEFIDLYADIIEERKHKITSISAEYDYVNALLTPIAGTIKYISSVSDADYALNHCPNKVFDENGNLNAEVSEPFIVSTIISYITQKPLSEMSEPMANQLLRLVAGDIIVPMFSIEKKEMNLQIKDLSALVYLLESITDSNLVTKILPFKCNIYSLIHDITESTADILHDVHISGSKDDFIRFSKEIVSLYNEAKEFEKDGGLINGMNPMDAYEDKIKSMFLYELNYADMELYDAYKAFFAYYSSMFSDPIFYNGLSDEDIRIISEMLKIINKENIIDADFGLQLQRLSYVLENFGNTQNLIYDPIVTGSGKININLINLMVKDKLEKGELTNEQFSSLSKYLSETDKTAFYEFKNYFTLVDSEYTQIIENTCGAIVGTDNDDHLTLESAGILVGNSGDDFLKGSNGNDILYGGDGDDRLYGNNGNDILDGGDGDDNLNGQNGNDILDGGAGNDDLRGDAGDDTYIFAKGYGNDTVYDWEDSNTIDFFYFLKYKTLQFIL